MPSSPDSSSDSSGGSTPAALDGPNLEAENCLPGVVRAVVIKLYSIKYLVSDWLVVNGWIGYRALEAIAFNTESSLGTLEQCQICLINLKNGVWKQYDSPQTIRLLFFIAA